MFKWILRKKILWVLKQLVWPYKTFVLKDHIFVAIAYTLGFSLYFLLRIFFDLTSSSYLIPIFATFFSPFFALIYDLKFPQFILKTNMTLSQVSIPKAERMVKNLSFWIPRQHREGISGDILEDCEELREFGCCEWRIRIHVLWQLAIGIVTLLPDAIISKIVYAIRKPEK